MTLFTLLKKVNARSIRLDILKLENNVCFANSNHILKQYEIGEKLGFSSSSSPCTLDLFVRIRFG